MQNKEALIIFVKNPILGKVKTRLAKDIGDEKALEVYRYLLSHTNAVTEELTCHRYIYFLDFIDDSIFGNVAVRNKKQMGNDLGERMLNAFKEVFQIGYSKVVIIGSDCASLSLNHLKKAFKELDENDVVVGPAVDGGYYLLGMNKFYPDLFYNKPWSTSKLITETRSEIESNGLSYAELSVLSDVDNLEDLQRIKKLKAFFLMKQDL